MLAFVQRGVTMAQLSISLPDSVIDDLNALAEAQHRTLPELVLDGLDQYRMHQRSLAKKERLTNASLRVRAASLEVNQEFAAFES
jgi:hypothetical protein